MQEELVKFYMNCLLPELIDPRHLRNLTIKEPDNILEAINKKKAKNHLKKS